MEMLLTNRTNRATNKANDKRTTYTGSIMVASVLDGHTHGYRSLLFLISEKSELYSQIYKWADPVKWIWKVFRLFARLACYLARELEKQL